MKAKAGVRSILTRLRESVDAYTDGFDVRSAPRTLGRDAARMYGVLTRERAREAEPRSRLKRLWYRFKILFLGLSYKLTPTRRVLFILCLVAAVLGFRSSLPGGTSIGLLSPEVFQLAAILGLVFLLGLELTDRVLVRDELEVARQLQHDLLPRTPPLISGYECAFSYRTANTIGGDYYDFVSLDDGRLAVISADASGHGIAAGLLMAITNATLKLAIDINPGPKVVAELLNRALCRTGGVRDFVTMFYAVLEPATGQLDYICVGHPFPLLRRASGELRELGVGCIPLGLRKQIDPEPGMVTLERGDAVVLYSDGFPEAINSAKVSFGFERVRHAVAAAGDGANAIHTNLVNELSRFVGDEPALDDRSLVVLARRND
jgi:sigma-B regulation protein RsbU (phosphoserine phosphatase)